MWRFVPFWLLTSELDCVPPNHRNAKVTKNRFNSFNFFYKNICNCSLQNKRFIHIGRSQLFNFLIKKCNKYNKYFGFKSYKRCKMVSFCLIPSIYFRFESRPAIATSFHFCFQKPFHNERVFVDSHRPGGSSNGERLLGALLVNSLSYFQQRTLTVGGSITVQLVSSLTRLELTNEGNIILFVFSEAV